MEKRFKAGAMVSFRLRKNEDERLIEWLNNQSSLSDSIHFLIEQCIQEEGLQDLGTIIFVKRDILPSSNEIADPLIKRLYDIGEEIHISDLYEPLADDFGLTQDQRNAKAKTTSEAQWNNNVRWAKEKLKNKDLVKSSKRGYWGMTDKGKKYVEDNLI